ncbi:hypothetical protein V7S43_018484 [Phytophthora oleae]
MHNDTVMRDRQTACVNMATLSSRPQSKVRSKRDSGGIRQAGQNPTDPVGRDAPRGNAYAWMV